MVHEIRPTPTEACASDCGGGEEGTLPPEVAEKIATHPCYSERAHHHFARIHVAVAPACNIQCHYCNRKFDCANENRPGVTSKRLTPEEAVHKVLAVARALPALSVVGIAGPGDPLANPRQTFETLEGVRRAAGDLTLCLSTNGLALPDHVDRIASLGVHHVTVTVNMVDPEVGADIYAWVLWNGQKVRGVEGARILADRQMEGLERLVERGILVKVNTVLIPGVNDAHVVEIGRVVKAKGAFLHNLMPLISSPEHGTFYGLAGQRGPTPEELEAAQRSCEPNTRLMRHCRQCRADAVGLLGEDRGHEFAPEALPEQPLPDAPLVRAAHRAATARVEARIADERATALLRLADLPPDLLNKAPGRVAVATRGEGLVNEHFGHAKEFLVYDVSPRGAQLVGHRKVSQYCQGGEGEEDTLEVSLRALSDCAAVLVARIGRCPTDRLASAGIEAVAEFAHQPIDVSVLLWFEGWVRRVAKREVAA